MIKFIIGWLLLNLAIIILILAFIWLGTAVIYWAEKHQIKTEEKRYLDQP